MVAWLSEDEEQEHRLYLPTTRSRVWNTIELRVEHTKNRRSKNDMWGVDMSNRKSEDLRAYGL